MCARERKSMNEKKERRGEEWREGGREGGREEGRNRRRREGERKGGRLFNTLMKCASLLEDPACLLVCT